MASRPTIAAIRFGDGLHPGQPTPAGPYDLLDGIATRSPSDGSSTAEALAMAASYVEVRRGGDDMQAADMRLHMRWQIRQFVLGWIARRIGATDGFGNRLEAFWFDHFAVRLGGLEGRVLVAPFLEDAIRPHIAGRFADLLRAATLHPAMLFALDQRGSIGPNSPFGLERGRGLNENLARELLELHTLGVDGTYAQTDVRQLAELLTGVTVHRTRGVTYAARRAEPGPETVLGKTYAAAGMGSVHEVIEDLAVHPDTARHLARKLCVHFLADEGAPELEARMADAYLASGGWLDALYAAMLEDDRAWTDLGAKARQPHDYMVACLRALEVPSAQLTAMDEPSAMRWVYGPMNQMGQRLDLPPGPQGWPEAASAWITAPALAARIGWAFRVAERLVPERDPVAFARTALADAAPEALIQSVAGAETRAEGVGIVLASAAFNRR